MKYRPEINGLRALAIIPVLLFHAGLKAFSGGFIGVDIFFVISGYLITTILYEELNTNHFSFANFYERRARRILPALFTVIAISIPFAWFYLMPKDMWEFSKSLGFVLFSLSNNYFYSQAGYFSAASELKPLIHTWSLAVEEQYYWLFPIFIFTAWKINKKILLPFLGLIVLLSLIYDQSIVNTNPEAAFFLLPSRIWELLIGSMVAIYLCNRKIHVSSKAQNQLSFLGFILIITSISFFNQSTQHPSLFTLAPVIGTSLIILFASNKNLIGRFLSQKTLVGIGLISYSTYLWHQPLLSFARHRSLNEPNQFFLLFLVLSSICLGYLSWKYIEQPFRDKNIIKRKLFFNLVIFFSLGFIYFGTQGYINGGYPERNIKELIYKKTENKINIESNSKLNSRIKENQSLPDISVGVYKMHFFGDLNAKDTVAVYGDSHAHLLVNGLNEIFISKKIKGVSVAMPDICEPIPYFVTNEINKIHMKSNLRTCTSSFKDLLAWLKTNASGVIISSRWTEKLYPIENEIDVQPFNNGEGGVELDLKRKDYLVLNQTKNFVSDKNFKINAIKEFIESFDKLNIPIYLIYPVPEMGWNIPRLNYKIKFLTGQEGLKTISVSYDLIKKRNHFIDQNFDSIKSKNILKIKPEDIFCNTYIKNRCIGQNENTTFYDDDDHLSEAGSKLLVQAIYKSIAGQVAHH